jgi:enamine deaminase RidA (YjgF/YER057c/UK114 family)
MLGNLRKTFQAAGIDLKDVVKAQVSLTDLDDFFYFGQVWKEFFPLPPRQFHRQACHSIQAVASFARRDNRIAAASARPCNRELSSRLRRQICRRSRARNRTPFPIHAVALVMVATSITDRKPI